MIKFLNFCALAIGYLVIATGIYTISPIIYKRVVQPPVKFAVGDCIKSYGSFEHKIIQIIPPRGLQEAMYGYTVGADCYDSPHYFDCSTSVGDVRIVNESSVKIECPRRH